MLTKDYQGAFYEMRTLDNEFVSSGTIRAVNTKSIELVSQIGDMPVLTLNTPVKIAIYSGAHGFRMIAGKVYLSTYEFVSIINIVKFVDFERRRFFRVDTDMSGKIVVTPEIYSRGGGEVPPESQIVVVRVKDLSLCGARLLTDLELKSGDVIPLHAVLSKSGEVELRLIVRRVGFKNPQGIRSCGCEILDLPSRVERQLCAFLFEQQRLQIRRQKRSDA